MLLLTRLPATELKVNVGQSLWTSIVCQELSYVIIVKNRINKFLAFMEPTVYWRRRVGQGEYKIRKNKRIFILLDIFQYSKILLKIKQGDMIGVAGKFL